MVGPIPVAMAMAAGIGVVLLFPVLLIMAVLPKNTRSVGANLAYQTM